MPRISPAIERANAILRAHGTPFRLREGHGSRWLSVYETRPGRRVVERAARGYAARDDRSVEELCQRLLDLASSTPPLGLEALLESGEPHQPRRAATPCWPEICDAVVAFQRGQGVNMNLVGPFRGSGYFRLLPPDQPAAIADVRRFALHTGASLKAHLDDPSGPLLPIPTHRQGFRQKREVVSLLRRAGYGAIAPVKLSEELKAMVNRKKQALVAAGQSRRRIPTTAAIEEWLDQVIAEDPLWGWVFAMIATYGLRPHEVWHIDGLPDADGLITIGVAARHIKVTKTGFRAAVPLPPAWVEIAPAEGRRHAYAIRARETTTWSYADVAAVMGHSTEVHRRTYLSEISGEQTKAAMVRRLLGEAA